MTILWEIDPTSEDATNAARSLVGTFGSVTYRLQTMDITPPAMVPLFASSSDTEGDPYVQARHQNRTISLQFLATATTDALLQTGIDGLQQKLDKLRREGGTLKFTTQAGTTLVGDVLYADFTPEFAKELYAFNKALRFTVDFVCLPYFRGTPVQLSDHVETTLPCLVFTEATIGGDVPALGKLIIDEDQGVNQWWVVWGVQSRYYDSAATAALFYEAEGRTAFSPSAAAAGPSGASGSGSNVMRNTALGPRFQAIMSTQTTGAGAHLSHIGTFRVFARVQVPAANTGTVTVCLEWSEGDYGIVHRNEVTGTSDASAGARGTWRLLDLGYVHLRKAVAGTQRWEGRILAQSTGSGDGIDIDYIFLIPVDEGSGEVQAFTYFPAPTSFTGRDEFTGTTAGGALNARTAPTGGTWATSGDTTDFLFSDDILDAHAEELVRTASNVGGNGRFAILGTATPTDVQIEVAFRCDDLTGMVNGDLLIQGVLAHWTSTSDTVLGVLQRSKVGVFPDLYQIFLSLNGKTAGVFWSDGYLVSIGGLGTTNAMLGAWMVLELRMTAAGIATLTLFDETKDRVIAGGVPSYHPQIATGGALATGKSGIYDYYDGSGTISRYYDNFAVSVPPPDAAIFASQSLEVRSDAIEREDSAGVCWQRPSIYEGRYLRVPPSGREARTARVIVKDSRGSLTTGLDSGIDDISARLTVTPRYLVLGP